MKKYVIGLIVILVWLRIMTIVYLFIGPRGPRLPDDPSYSETGEWNIYFNNGLSFENAECVYWYSEQNKSEWVLRDGTRIIQSGDIVYTVTPNTQEGGNE